MTPQPSITPHQPTIEGDFILVVLTTIFPPGERKNYDVIIGYQDTFTQYSTQQLDDNANTLQFSCSPLGRSYFSVIIQPKNTVDGAVGQVFQYINAPLVGPIAQPL